MSEAKTIQGLWGEVVDEKFRGDTTAVAIEFLRRHGDALINPGFIVTADRLEAAAETVYLTGWRRFGEGNPVPWCEVDEEVRTHYRAVATAAITAAGGIVPDEVVEVDGEAPGALQSWPVFRDENGLLTGCGIDPGDRIYIVRADTSTASTGTADTSKDGPGIDRGE